MAQEVPRRYIAATGALQFVVFVLVGAATLRLWPGPSTPLLWFAAIGALPMLVLATSGAWSRDPTKTHDAPLSLSSPPLSTRLRMALLPVLVWAGLFASLLTLWALPSLRAAAVELGIDHRLRASLERALFDPAPDVSLAACQGLETIGSEQSQRRLATRLMSADDALTSCLLTNLDDAWNEDVLDMELAAAAWRRELHATKDAERACLLADRLRHAERLGVDKANGWLLACAVDGPTEPAKTCCAQALRGVLGRTGAELAMLLPPPNVAATGELGAIAGPLLEASFGDPSVDARVRRALDLDAAPQRAWSLGLACESLSTRDLERRAQVATALGEAIRSESCHPETPGESTLRVWQAACGAALELSEPGEPPEERLCRSVDLALRLEARAVARSAVQRAARRARDPASRQRLLERLMDWEPAQRLHAERERQRRLEEFQQRQRDSIMDMLLGGSPERGLFDGRHAHDGHCCDNGSPAAPRVWFPNRRAD